VTGTQHGWGRGPADAVGSWGPQPSLLPVHPFPASRHLVSACSLGLQGLWDGLGGGKFVKQAAQSWSEAETLASGATPEGTESLRFFDL
jgi:hypothetical protein